MCFKREGKIPYDHPEAMGHDPVYSHVGGEMSNRTEDGRRSNHRQRGPWNTANERGLGGRRQNGEKKSRKKMDVTSGHNSNGETGRANGRPMPKIANPGNVIPLIVKARVGGGHMGSSLCHDNEAPYPEALAQFFVECYSPPGGLVCDPFSGSGTTGAVAVRLARRFTGCDLRQSQVDLSRRRIETETPDMFLAAEAAARKEGSAHA